MSKKIEHKTINRTKYKWCSGCETWKELSCFNKATYNFDKLTYICKDCLSKQSKRGRPAGYVMDEISKKK